MEKPERARGVATLRARAPTREFSMPTIREYSTPADTERDRGQQAGPTTDERERIKALERENRELRQANEILRKASAYFALAELDRRSRT